MRIKLFSPVVKSGSIHWLFVACVLFVLHICLQWVLPDYSSECYSFRVDGDTCAVLSDDHEIVTFSVPVHPSGRKAGLYVFHGTRDLQYFRLVQIWSDQMDDQSLIFTSDTNGGVKVADGWDYSRKKGFVHSMSLGHRGVQILDVTLPASYRLDVAFEKLRDAGVLLFAKDAKNGIGVAVRPVRNDVLVFPLQDGTPGELIAIGQLEHLQLTRELLRLLKSVSWFAGFFMLAAYFISMLPTYHDSDSAKDLGEHRPSSNAHLLFTDLTTSKCVCLSIIVFVVLALVATFGVGRVPHITDETSYLFQAKIFAQGHIRAPLPENPAFFTFEHVIQHNGFWFSKYPPLFPLILSFGVRLGCPWLVNPVLGGLLAFFLLMITNRHFGSGTTWIAWLLIISSPFWVIMGASHMSHIAAALFLTIAWYAGIRFVQDGSWHDALFCGVGLLGTILTRPYTAFWGALPLGVIQLVSLFRSISSAGSLHWRRRTMGMVLIGGIGGIGILLLIIWNRAVAGVGGFPLNLYDLYDPSDVLGFGVDKGIGQRMTWGSWGHTPAKAIRSFQFYMDHLSHYLFGWPFGLSLFAVPLAFLLGSSNIRKKAMIFLLPWSSLIIGHLFYWATEHVGYGPRYWFAALPGMIIVSAVGLHVLCHCMKQHAQNIAIIRYAPLILVGGLALSSISIYFPSLFSSLRARHSFGNVRIREAVQLLPKGERTLIFSSSDTDFYYDGLFLQDPFMQDEVVIARDRGAENHILMRQYPDSSLYVWDGARLLARKRVMMGVKPSE